MSESTLSVQIRADAADAEAAGKRAAAAIAQVGQASTSAASQAKAASSAITAEAQAMTALGSAGNAATTAAGKVVTANNAVAHSSTAVRRELIVLAHEMAMGNYTRLGGSMMVLSERLGNIPPMAIAAAAGFGALAFGGYELTKSLIETANAVGTVEGRLASMGRGAEVADGSSQAMIAGIANKYNLSTRAVAEFVAIIDTIPDASAKTRAALSDLVPGIATANHDELNKVAESLARGFESSSSLEKFTQATGLLGEGLQKTIADSKATGSVFGAQEAAVSALTDKWHAYNDELNNYRQGTTFSKLFQPDANVGTYGMPTAQIPDFPKVTDIKYGPSASRDAAQQTLAVIAANEKYLGQQREVNDLTTRQKALTEQLAAPIGKSADQMAQLRAELDGVNKDLAKANAGPSQVGAWREQLQAQLEAQNKFGKDALGAELQFWTAKKALAAAGSADEREVSTEIYQIRSQLAAQSIGLEKKETEELKKSIAERMRQEEEEVRHDMALNETWTADQMREQEEAARESIRTQIDAAREIEDGNVQMLDQLKSEWDRTNEEIGKSFSQSVLDAIEGKKGGIQQALRKITEDLLGSVFTGIGKSLASTLEEALGVGGSSPGSMLSGVLGDGFLSNLLGGKSLLGGGPGGDPGAAAMTELNTTMQSMGLVTAANTASQAAATAGQAANTVATGANTGGLLTGVATWIENTVATVANTVATDAAAIASFIGFAGGGRPPVGVPSVVGERGPELFMPDAAGTVVPNGSWGIRSFDDAGAGAGSGSSSSFTGGDFAPSISMPVSFHGGTASMSKAEFRRMLGGHMDYLVGELKNLHRNGGRGAFA